MTVAPSLNGHALHSVSLHVGECGVWTAECKLTEAPELPAANAILRIGATELRGTITEAQVFGLALGARVVGGAGGWAKILKPQAYHNDAGIKAALVAQDAAREAGETLGTFAPGAERVGVDYVRRIASAATTLEYAAGGVPWHVGYDGVTRVEPRPTDTVPAAAYQLLAYDPVEQTALLAIDDFAQLVPGRVLAGHGPIRDIELASIKGSPLRATAWLGTGGGRPCAGRLGGLLQAVVSRMAGVGELHGVYRYRVVRMRGDLRVDLQAVRKAAGFPDLQAIAQAPGLPGLAAELAPGCEVLVSFVDGDRTAPLITHYAGPGSTGFVPVGVVLGGTSGQPAARQGDSVRVLIPPALFTGTIAVGGVPAAATGVVSWLAPNADGTITGGSGKVRIA